MHFIGFLSQSFYKRARLKSQALERVRTLPLSPEPPTLLPLVMEMESWLFSSPNKPQKGKTYHLANPPPQDLGYRRLR